MPNSDDEKEDALRAKGFVPVLETAYQVAIHTSGVALEETNTEGRRWIYLHSGPRLFWAPEWAVKLLQLLRIEGISDNGGLREFMRSATPELLDSIDVVASLGDLPAFNAFILEHAPDVLRQYEKMQVRGEQ